MQMHANTLNCVFNNAGVQRRLEFVPGTPLDEEGLGDEINTNVLGVMRVAAEFIPHLTRQSNAVLVNVSSGLAFVPMARFPVYCATKAAVHSFTLSLRHQLKASGVKVIELIPPYVATELGGPRKTVGPGGPQPMPLPAFIAETMEELAKGSDEVAVGDARNLVAATNIETLKRIFEGMNRKQRQVSARRARNRLDKRVFPLQSSICLEGADRPVQLLQPYYGGAPSPGLGRRVVKGDNERRPSQHRAHDLPLHADAAAVNDAQGL
jgi:short-subunit dehydrogenase involved in D-alanine esterification of teichoic acids